MWQPVCNTRGILFCGTGFPLDSLLASTCNRQTQNVANFSPPGDIKSLPMKSLPLLDSTRAYQTLNKSINCCCLSHFLPLRSLDIFLEERTQVRYHRTVANSPYLLSEIGLKFSECKRFASSDYPQLSLHCSIHAIHSTSLIALHSSTVHYSCSCSQIASLSLTRTYLSLRICALLLVSQRPGSESWSAIFRLSSPLCFSLEQT